MDGIMLHAGGILMDQAQGGIAGDRSCCCEEVYDTDCECGGSPIPSQLTVTFVQGRYGTPQDCEKCPGMHGETVKVTHVPNHGADPKYSCFSTACALWVGESSCGRVYLPCNSTCSSGLSQVWVVDPPFEDWEDCNTYDSTDDCTFPNTYMAFDLQEDSCDPLQYSSLYGSGAHGGESYCCGPQDEGCGWLLRDWSFFFPDCDQPMRAPCGNVHLDVNVTE